MEIVKENNGSVQLLRLRGRIDIQASHELSDSLMETLDPDVRTLVMDLSAIEYISSSGLKNLLQIRRKLRDLGGAVVLCGVKSHLAKVLKVVGFDLLFPIVETEEEALAFCPRK